MMKISLLLGFMSISFAHNTMAMDHNGGGMGMSDAAFTALKQELQEAINERDYGFALKRSESALQTHEGLTDAQQIELAKIMSNAYTHYFPELVQHLNHALGQKQYDYVKTAANAALHNHQNPLTEEQKLTLVSLISQATEALEKAERDIMHGQYHHGGAMQHHGGVMHDHDFQALVQNLNHALGQKQYDYVIKEANKALDNHQTPLTEEQQFQLVSIISQATEAVEKAERDIMHGQYQYHQAYVDNPEDFRDRDVVHKMEDNQHIRDRFNPGDHNANQSSYFNPNEGKKAEDRMDPELKRKLDARRSKDQ